MTFDLRRWALEDPDRLAVRVGNVDTTYGELEAVANRVAHVLRAHGVERGDHVAALMGNTAPCATMGPMLASTPASTRCALPKL